MIWRKLLKLNAFLKLKNYTQGYAIQMIVSVPNINKFYVHLVAGITGDTGIECNASNLEEKLLKSYNSKMK